MSTSEELRMRARLAVRAGCGTEVIFNRAADELDALQAKLGRVRALCADKNFQFASTLAREVLAAIDKEANDG